MVQRVWRSPADRFATASLPGTSGQTVQANFLIDTGGRSPFTDTKLSAQMYYAAISCSSIIRRNASSFSRPRKPFGHDESGLFLVAEGANLKVIRVFRVMHASPPDSAGIRDGDEIVSLGGKKGRPARAGASSSPVSAGASKILFATPARRQTAAGHLITRDLLSSANSRDAGRT